MLFTNFAPNESWDDAWLSFKLLFQPWRWQKGHELNQAKEKILKILILTKNHQISFFFSGRSALYNLLKSLNLKPGDEILIQAFTCEAVILPIMALNLKPVYLDIETESFSINPIDLEKKLTSRAKVLILQHTFAITPIQRKTILFLVRKHNLVLIEDIAHTIKKSNITRRFGGQNLKLKNHFFLLSFGRSKSVSSVFGGAIVGNDKKIMKRLNNLPLKKPSYKMIFKLLLYKPIVFLIKLTYSLYIGKIIHKLANKFNILIPEISLKEKHGEFDELFNKSYPNALAILLLNQLKKLSKTNNQRVKIVNFYLNSFYNKLNQPNHLNSGFYVIPYTLYFNQPLIRFPLLIKNRDQIIQELTKKNIFLGKWYDSPVAPKDLSLDRVEYKVGNCPIAEKTCQQIINLPTNVKIEQAKKIIKSLKN